MVAGVRVVAKFKMCSVRNDAIYYIETSVFRERKVNKAATHKKKLQARERAFFLGFWWRAVLLSEHGALHS